MVSNFAVDARRLAASPVKLLRVDTDWAVSDARPNPGTCLSLPLVFLISSLKTHMLSTKFLRALSNSYAAL